MGACIGFLMIVYIFPVKWQVKLGVEGKKKQGDIGDLVKEAKIGNCFMEIEWNGHIPWDALPAPSTILSLYTWC